jgi:hypothetical protein
VVLAAASAWSEAGVQAALADFIRPGITASRLGVGWLKKSGDQELDGLWPLEVSVHGKYLIVSDTPALMESVLSNFGRKPDREPAQLFAGFNHQRERNNFSRFVDLIDGPNVNGPNIGGPNAGISDARNGERQPQFFSGNMASLSATLAEMSAERLEVRGDGGKVRQTVTYEWSQ